VESSLAKLPWKTPLENYAGRMPVGATADQSVEFADDQIGS
jgi:hypothetical protein